MSNLLRKLLETAPLIHRTPDPGGMLKRAKYCLRGLAFASLTLEWFDFLEDPELAYIVQRHPHLFHKLQRPYLNRNLKTDQRLAALKQHYRFILTEFSGPTIEGVFSPMGKLLANLPAEKTESLELRLVCGRMQKEGDLTLCLTGAGSTTPIATLSFSVWKYDADRKEIFIGGLQGDKNTDKETVVAITRGLYGLRPKALMVYTLQQLAAGWNMTRLQAVSDDMHIYRHFQSHRNVRASYDKFWIECDGTSTPEGSFELPVEFVPREMSSIRVNKRQMYRRRYVMLQDIASQIRANMSIAEACPDRAQNVLQFSQFDDDAKDSKCTAAG